MIFNPLRVIFINYEVENCESNSRLVVDEDNNGKLRLKKVNHHQCIAKIDLISHIFTTDIFLNCLQIEGNYHEFVVHFKFLMNEDFTGECRFERINNSRCENNGFCEFRTNIDKRTTGKCIHWTHWKIYISIDLQIWTINWREIVLNLRRACAARKRDNWFPVYLSCCQFMFFIASIGE